MIKVPFSVVIPFNGSWPPEFLSRFESLNAMGLTVDDVIAEAFKICTAVVERQHSNDMVCYIDYTAVEHVIDAVTVVNDAGQHVDAKGLQVEQFVWDTFTDLVGMVYELIWTPLQHAYHCTIAGHQLPQQGYRCEDVLVKRINSMRDGIYISSDLVLRGDGRPVEDALNVIRAVSSAATEAGQSVTGGWVSSV